MATTVDLGKVRPVWKGTWSGSTAYEVHDMVKSGLDSYICTTGHTSSGTFSNDSANWDTLATGFSGDAADLTTGTIPDARFPATLPAVDGSSLTGLSSAILQVRYVRWSPGGTYTLPNGSPISPGLDITFTPQSSTSTILHVWTGAIQQNGSSQNMNVEFYRDGAHVGGSNHAGAFLEDNTYMVKVEQNVHIADMSTGHTAGTAHSYQVYTWTSNSAFNVANDQSHLHILYEIDSSVVTYDGENT